MKKYIVNEIFYSLQGEGIRYGIPNIFIRFSKCNLSCSFCDTEFESGYELTSQEILSKCMEFLPCKNIIFTGGEPLLQLDQELIDLFKKQEYYLALETNGSLKPPDGLDWICVSPKVADHVVKQNFCKVIINELKYVRQSNQEIPSSNIVADYYLISPVFTGEFLTKDNLFWCIELVKKNPKWRLTVQHHKLWNIR